MRNKIAKELRALTSDRQHYQQLKRTWSRTPRPLRDIQALASAMLTHPKATFALPQNDSNHI